MTVTCESRDGRRHHCDAATLGQVTLSRQLTRDNNCVENRTWGYDTNGIWVDRGCRADFLITENSGNRSDYRDGRMGRATRTLVCESKGRARTYCRADAAFGVALTRQLSSRNCVENRTWGSDQNGVWVSHGCRAEFALNSGRRNR